MSADRPILLREAQDADGEAIARLIAAVFAEYPDCPFIPAEFPELAAAATHYAAQGGQLWVAEQDGVIIGSLAVLKTFEPGLFALAKVYVAKPWRGTGLAARLLAQGEAFVRAHGGQALTLWSDTRFTAGHAFYRKHGFQQEAGVRQLHDVAQSVEFRFKRPIRAEAR